MTGDCTKVRDVLLERARLTGQTRATVDAHLAICPDCASFAARAEGMLVAWRSNAARLSDGAAIDRVRAALRPEIERCSHRAVTKRPWFAIFTVTATAAALIIAVWWGTARPPRDVSHASALIAREATHALAGHAPSALVVGASLADGEDVEVGRGGRAVLRFGPHQLVCAGGSAVRLVATEPQRVALDLSHGRVVGHVDPSVSVGTNKPSFSVAWFGGEVVVTGTIFEVVADARSSTVAVARGEVRVHLAAGGVPLRVRAGTRLSLEAGDVEWSELDGHEIDAMVSEVGEEPTYQTPIPSEKPRVAPLPSRPETRTTRDRAMATESPAEIANRGDCMSATAAFAAAPAGREQSRIGRDCVAIAECLRSTGAVDEAIGWYERAVSSAPRSAAAENAAFEIGRLEADAGAHDRAHAAFARYLKLYPTGALAADATLSLCTAEVNGAHADEALACLRDYRSRFPAAHRVRDTFMLEATVLRAQKHDCAAAIRAYRTYLASPGGVYAKEAEDWVSWCEANAR